MTSAYDSEIERLLDEVEEKRRKAVETRRQINEMTATATAPRKTVKVTVNGRGDLVGIEFPTGAYRRMAPKELADAITEAAREAHGLAREKTVQLVSADLPDGVDLKSLLEGGEGSFAFPEPPSFREVLRDHSREEKQGA